MRRRNSTPFSYQVPGAFDCSPQWNSASAWKRGPRARIRAGSRGPRGQVWSFAGPGRGPATGMNARRYHGLLVAAVRPPVERHVLLSRLDEVVLPDLALATNQYPGVVHPNGARRLLEFRREPFPTWTFDAGGGARLEKQVSLVPGEQTVVVRYRSTQPRRLAIPPFLAFRDYHSLMRANDAID